MVEVTPPRSTGTLATTRRPLPWPSGRPFRILSIDGGGIKGILPATLLGELERRYLGNRSIGAHFDLIAGTSTGGIIALGLAHGMTAREIGALYLDKGDRIFPVDGPFSALLRKLRGLITTAYDREPLKAELTRIFGETQLGEAQNRLCIPAFEGTHGEPLIYKTPHHPDYRADQYETMRDVALATSAAPTYLRALENNGYVLVDGGMVANNPIMVGLVDALACNDIPRHGVEIVSLGCGSSPFALSEQHHAGGQLQWRHALLAAMDASSRSALGQAYLLVGKDRVLRIDPPSSDKPIDLADFRRARDELPTTATALADAYGDMIAQRFLHSTVQPAPMPGRK
ncbi:MAG: patatin [Spiribacter salinus]|uniref:Patatin n=1 Tax=Spiribacter salinus TaxID=1335746 RepID=A0A540VPL5_9GAMM|nr:MAG: patatin [Spiribacter salinus]